MDLMGTAAPDAPTDLIKDGSDATFMQDVVEASDTVPVIVDFWAPWCGPCKQLGPALEAAVQKAKGAVKMVKVNVDENPGIAGQLRVQSIPTVYAFHKGQPVDGFQGALPGSQIDEFIGKMAALGGGSADGGLSDAVEAAEEMLEAGAAADAAETFAAILQEDPNYAAAFGGLARAYVALGDLDQAQAVLNGAPAESAGDAAIETAQAAIDLAKQAEDAGPVGDLQAQVEADPDNHQARFDLATALHANGNTQEAIDQLLDIVRRDRDGSPPAPCAINAPSTAL